MGTKPLTNANKISVIDAYSMSLQGFFIKPNNMDKLETIKTIMEYWSRVLPPVNRIDKTHWHVISKHSY